jgi:hypothetical protein
MEEADSSEMLTLLYQITRCHMPKDRNFNYPLLREGLGVSCVRQTVKLMEKTNVLGMKNVFLYSNAFIRNIVSPDKYVASYARVMTEMRAKIRVVFVRNVSFV